MNEHTSQLYEFGSFRLLKVTGRHAEAIAHNQRAQELDPLSPWLNATLAWAFYYAGQYDRALTQCWKALEIEPRFGITHWTLGWSIWRSINLRKPSPRSKKP